MCPVCNLDIRQEIEDKRELERKICKCMEQKMLRLEWEVKE